MRSGDILDYCAEIDWFDRQLGGLLAMLEKTGELIVPSLVTSDNGMPFRAKANLYDWGVRMPLNALARASSRESDRRFRESPDLAPTFLEAAGLTPPREISGTSPAADRRASRLCLHGYGASHLVPPEAPPIRCAIRTRDFLYIRNFKPDRWPTVARTSSHRIRPSRRRGQMKVRARHSCWRKRQTSAAVRTKLRQASEEELYDLAHDEFQMNNVATAEKYQDQKRKLWARQYLEKTGDPRIAGQDPWQSYAYRQTIGFGATFNRSLPESEREEARKRATHKPE